jgi:hypothetical protein
MFYKMLPLIREEIETMLASGQKFGTSYRLALQSLLLALKNIEKFH